MERESLDGREGDDERTENERSPPPRSRPTTRDHARKEAERRRSRGNTPVPAKKDEQLKVKVEDRHEETSHQDRERRHSRSRSRSALRDREHSGSGHDEKIVDKKSNGKIADNVNGNKRGHSDGAGGLDQDGRNGNENGLRKRRRVRHRNRNSRKRHNNRRDDRGPGNRRDDRGPDRHHDNHNKRYKPYTELSWEERQQRDEQESKRAAQRRANRPTPYNTTQFLMEDHKVDTPDLSSVHHNMQCDSSDEIEDEMNGDYLEKDFSAVYEEVQSERLESMSKEQLVNEVLTLQRRVTELEEEQKRRLSSAGDSDQSSSGQQPVDKGLRKRLESLSSLEGEVHRLRSENSKLRKASLKEPVAS